MRTRIGRAITSHQSSVHRVSRSRIRLITTTTGMGMSAATSSGTNCGFMAARARRRFRQYQIAFVEGPNAQGCWTCPDAPPGEVHKSSGPAIRQVPLADFIREQAHWHVREGGEEISFLWRELNHPGANHESPESTHADLEAGESEHPEQQRALRFSVRILLLLDPLLPAARDGRCRQSRFAGNHNRLDDRAAWERYPAPFPNGTRRDRRSVT